MFAAWIVLFTPLSYFRIFSYDHLCYFIIVSFYKNSLKNMVEKYTEYYSFKKDTRKVPKLPNLTNTEDVYIAQSSPLSSQSILESQETQPSGTPSLFISQHLKASREVHLSGSQDSISAFQVMSDSQNKLPESQTSLQTSDNVKYVQQVTESKSEPSSWQPGSIHSRKTRNKKQKKKKSKQVCFPILILNGKILCTLHSLF